MAATAELSDHTALQTYELVDAIPEVFAARQAVRADAEQILNRRRQARNVGGAAVEMPLPVDALSTAHKVLKAAEIYGENSIEHRELSQAIVLDCQRLVGEWYRKLKPEYFEPVRHVFNQTTEEFFSHGLSIRQMTENALTPMAANQEEEARRVNERVEDATPQIMRKLGVLATGSVAIRTVSECTDKAIHDYRTDVRDRNAHRGYGGYVPEIEKVMIRDMRLDDTTSDRFEEQVGLPGIYINHYVIQKALSGRGADVMGLTKTELHGAQILARDDLMDFVRLLDETASEEWCVNVFMGEVVSKDFVKDYRAFRSEALGRQERLQDVSRTVATYVVSLAEDAVDRRHAPAKVEEFVKMLLLNLGKEDVAIAEQMFDEPTAKGLREVALLEAEGRFQEAFVRMEEVRSQAPGGGFCGAGSCGLEAVNVSSDDGKRLASKVGAKAGDTVLKDKERACKCGSKSIVYAYNASEVKKYCDSCGRSERKASKVAPSA